MPRTPAGLIVPGVPGFFGGKKLVIAGGGGPLDVEGATNSIFSSTASGTISVTTSGTDRVVIVEVSIEGSTLNSVLSVTSPNLTFSRRKQFQLGANQTLEVWWAHAASAVTSETIMVTLASTPDDVVLIGYAISGAGNPSSPWDTNASLPAAAGGSSPSVTISTDSTNSILLAFIGSVIFSQQTISGFTNISFRQNGGGSNFDTAQALQQIVSAAQSSLTITISGIICVLIADAIAGS